MVLANCVQWTSTIISQHLGELLSWVVPVTRLQLETVKQHGGKIALLTKSSGSKKGMYISSVMSLQRLPTYDT